MATRAETAAATRLALLDAAASLLDEGGTEAVTLRAVGARAGVSRGAPYGHFADKEDLLAALAIGRWVEMTEDLERLRTDPRLAERERLSQALRTTLRLARDRPHLSALMFVPPTRDPDLLTSAASGSQDAFLAIVADVVGAEAARRTGALLLSSTHGIAGMEVSGQLGQTKWGTTERRSLRVLINNAGIAVNAPIEVLTLHDWRQQFDVSVFGQIAVTRALLLFLLASRGRILNITSVGGRIAMANYGAYSAAKFAMEAVSDSLRREVEDLGVKVIKITPGAVSTNMTTSGLAASARIAGTMTPEQHERYDVIVKAFVAQAEGFARDGVTADHAAAVISRAVAARRPKTRYTIGRDGAILTGVSRIASDRLLDRILRSQNTSLAKARR